MDWVGGQCGGEGRRGRGGDDYTVTPSPLQDGMEVRGFLVGWLVCRLVVGCDLGVTGLFCFFLVFLFWGWSGCGEVRLAGGCSCRGRRGAAHIAGGIGRLID